MKLTKFGTIGAIVAVGALALAGCAANEGGTTPSNSEAPASSLSGSLTGVGASAQGSAQEGLIAAFTSLNSGVAITYSPDGSGAGREAFIGGGAQFAGSDRAFKVEEIAESTFALCAPDSGIIELPLYVSPIAIVFNLDGIESLDLDTATIAGIFAGTITSWDDAAIAATNDGVTLPATPIAVVHRSDDSGTQENFTDFLEATAPDVWTFGVDGEWTGPAGEGASGSSGIVDAVAAGQGKISFVDASRAGDFGTVNIGVGGAFVGPTAEAAAALVDASPLEEGRTAGDLAVALDRTTTDEAAYPATLISYLIGCETYADAATAELVAAYFAFIASEDGQAASQEASGSAPISASTRSLVEAAIALIS